MRLFLLLALSLSPALAGAQQAIAAAPAQARSPLRWQNFAKTPPSPAATQTPAPAPARPQVETTSDYLTRMDSDGDGRVSSSEYIDWLGYAFDEMDRDRNGMLSTNELPGGKGRTVTREQHRQGLAERFRKQDANRDGWLSARELSAPPQ